MTKLFLYPLLYFCGISKSMLLCSGGIGLHLLPILVCVLTFVAVTTCYFLSLTQDHISPYFPYISDAGSKIPESCIFGQLLNIVSVLAGLCFYSWHKHLLDCSQKFNQQCYRQIRLARVALCFGLICAVGMSIVANFQSPGGHWTLYRKRFRIFQCPFQSFLFVFFYCWCVELYFQSTRKIILNNMLFSGNSCLVYASPRCRSTFWWWFGLYTCCYIYYI
ncbi:unnamed protein product [Schistosoma bovis]|nr:unnamed protein product [Schistosoma bovis]